jgi:AcrR family transcriptional regulator
METSSTTQGADTRALAGEKAQRIVEAMRDSVAEVGIAGSTFERVSAKAGVSRGLLHYYFGTKERLLVEVIRRDTEYRIDTLGGSLRAAGTVDEVIRVLFAAFSRTVAEEQGYVYMVSELFIAGRHQPEIQRQLGSLYSRARTELAAILREKEAEEVLSLRFDAESVVTHMLAVGDGAIVQLLTDRTLDVEASAAVSDQVYRFLLDS